jgi:AmmeMemoRadiSam system protein B
VKERGLPSKAPESNDHVNRFLGRLGDLAAKESDRLLWVLSIDMAHMGQRYGDEFPAYADRAEMLDIAERDRRRIDRINASDAQGFWDLVKENHDDLKWCGSAPLYTFLKAAMPSSISPVVRARRSCRFR